MARFWPIHVVVLVIFLAATENFARAPGSEAIPKKRTFLEKLENLVSSAVQRVRSFGSKVKTLYRNFDLIGALATEQLQSSFRVIKLLESWRKPDVGDVTKPPVVTTQQRVVTTKTMKKTQTACGDRWEKFGTSFFLFCTCVQNCTFSIVKNECREKQAQPAKCSSRKLETFFVRSLKTSTYVFLGGNDRVEEGTWRWPDGSLLNESYTNWYSGKPYHEAKADCLLLHRPTRKWYNWWCDYEMRPAFARRNICEGFKHYMINPLQRHDTLRKIYQYRRKYYNTIIDIKINYYTKHKAIARRNTKGIAYLESGRMSDMVKKYCNNCRCGLFYV